MPVPLSFAVSASDAADRSAGYGKEPTFGEMQPKTFECLLQSRKEAHGCTRPPDRASPLIGRSRRDLLSSASACSVLD